MAHSGRCEAFERLPPSGFSPEKGTSAGGLNLGVSRGRPKAQGGFTLIFTQQSRAGITARQFVGDATQDWEISEQKGDGPTRL